MTIPRNLRTIGDARLAALDRSYDTALKREIERVAKTDVRFARVLREALTVEDEVLRRQAA